MKHIKIFDSFLLESSLPVDKVIFSIVPSTSDFPVKKNMEELGIPYVLNWFDDPNLEEKFHSSIDQIAGVIIHGGPLESFSQLGQIPKSILESRIPKLGICLGMEVMGVNLGAKLVEAKESEENPGKNKFSIAKCKLDDCLLFEGIGQLPGIYKVPFSHKYILGSKPSKVEIIASSIETPIAGIYHKETNSYGVQFGIANTLIGEKILYNFYRKIC
jgi:GMP synthase-like glutamine amidotransferase